MSTATPADIRDMQDEGLAVLAKHRLCYVGTPYTKYPDGIEQAFIDACKITAKLMLADVKVYSPIAHTHPIAIYGGIDPLNHGIWLPFDRSMMDAADAMIVAMMESWDNSYGVKHEINVFTRAGKPVYYLDPITMSVNNSPFARRNR